MKLEYGDGFNYQWVASALMDGVLEIPIIQKQNHFVIPDRLVPFSCRNRDSGQESLICFYEDDKRFSDFILHPDQYIGDLKKFAGIISVDASLYLDMPLCLQIADVYFNRALGHYLQKQGMYVIPNIRWGDERTFTTCVLPEKTAFLGVEKHGIVSIGTYGQIRRNADKQLFRDGLEAMLDELAPEVVLVYGPMPHKIFHGLEDRTQFIPYLDWTTLKKGGVDNGNH